MNILTPFDNFINEAKKHQSFVNLDARLQSREQLAVRGLPSRKDEAWRNTSLKFLNEYTFVPSSLAPVVTEKIKSLVADKKIPDTNSLVFVNGFYISSLSNFDTQNIVVEKRDDIKTQSQEDVPVNPIQSLNDLYNLNPLEIVVMNDLAKPVQIINLTDSENVVTSPKMKIIVKANKEAKFVLSHGGPAFARYFSNAYFLFEVEKDARLELINHTNQSVNAYHFDNVNITAAAASTVRYFELNFNALMTRHEFSLNLNGEHIQSEVLGASYLRDKQHCDSQTAINHNQSNSRSEQIYKSLLDDESHSVFSGTVFIAHGIAKADSAQLNQNLLLSEHAEVNSKPVLRIFSDDVKASHGSTMGQIQEEEIFYLQSRSIARSKAIELLGQGFLNEIILKMGSEELKRHFSKELLAELSEKRKPQLKVLK